MAVEGTSFENFSFASKDGKSPVVAYLWIPPQGRKPRAIIQIAHGMAEHMGRYDHLARYLAGQGFIVCGNDHIGHGKSVNSKAEWGCMPVKGGCGILVEDCHQLRTAIQQRFGMDTPYIFFGHSMGSFVARAYIAQHAEGLAGAIICGTGFVAKAVCQAGGMLARQRCSAKGPDYLSKTLNSMADGAYSNAIKNARTPLDWLSYDEAVVDAYIADEMSGFPFKASGYATLMDLCTVVNDQATVNKVPRELPVLIIAGADDPVGDMGKGVRTVHEMFKKAHVEDLTCKIYPHMRHEIHNELEKQDVYSDISGWISARVADVGEVPATLRLLASDPQAAAEAESAAAAHDLGKARYVIALDQGTTSSRSMLIDRRGNLVDSAQEHFEQLYPQPGWVGHRPQDIRQTQLGTLMRLVAANGLGAADVAAIGITNQRETTIVWDRRTGEPIADAIVWQCRRTAPLVEAVCDTPEIREYIQLKTGLAPDAYFSASKIRWLLDNTPGAWDLARAGHLAFGTVDTWLIYQLTGGAVHATDYTNASRTMLFDIHECRWDQDLFDLWGIPMSMAPKALPSAGIYGTVAYGPLAGVPIAGVVGDQQAALFGQCCFRAGQAKATYGTGCFMLMNTGAQAKRSTHGLVTTIAASAPGVEGVEYALEGSVYSCASMIQWVRDSLGIIKKSYETEALAKSVPDNAGVYLVPAFTGLGAPYWNSEARAAIVGLTRGATGAHIARASLEAVAYQLADLMEAMEADAGARVDALNVDGGVSANDFCMQFQSDILDKPVCRPQNTETTSLGAAFLAGLAVGYWSGIEELRGLRDTDDVFKPSMEGGERSRLMGEWHAAVARVL